MRRPACSCRLIVSACDLRSASIASRVFFFSACVSLSSATTSAALAARRRIAVLASSTADMGSAPFFDFSVAGGEAVRECGQAADPKIQFVSVSGGRLGGCGGFRGRSGRGNRGVSRGVLVGVWNAEGVQELIHGGVCCLDESNGLLDLSRKGGDVNLREQV